MGLELATLLSIATRDKGVVVCSQPIYRPDSLMERVANTSDYDRLILSTTDICTFLHAEGTLDTEEYRRAIVFLTTQGQTTRRNVTRKSLDGPVYIDALALSYLHSAGVLHSVAAAGLNLHVHPQVLNDTQALIAAADTGYGLGARLDDIRTLLRDALDSGTASFLSRTADRDEHIRKRGIRFQTTASLLAGCAACDAICIDDRAINRQPNIENDGRPPTSIVCVLDVLRHLVSCGGLKDRSDYWIARHKLRRGGFALIDVEADELVHWLRVTRVVDGQVMETAELRTLRQTITRIDSLNLLSHEETMAHSIHHSRACRTALECLWGDSSVAVERVAALSSWVWRNLMVGAVLGLEESAGENRRNRAGHLLSLRLGHLLLPTTVLTQERRSQFIDWLDQVALEPLRPANTELLEAALESNWQAIVALEDHREVYGHWFLQQLPSSACELVISKHPEFAERCGFKSSLVIEIGSAIKIESSELVHAVRDVLATNGHKTVHDVLGRTASVTIDPTTQHIVLTWSDSQGTSQQVPLQELAVLSPDRETKRKAFGSLVKRIGATGPDCLYSLRDRPSHDLNDREIAGLLTELTHGVATVHSRLFEKLSQGLSLTADDIVPKHVSYYESFGGPNPGLHDAEAYYREILIPYRQGILKNNVQAGLDICLLGALRDDLAPGQWLTEYHDDVVWDAMAACHARDNPFSLLGALDIALYRQTDARFAEFAAEAVRSLSSEQCGDRDDLDSCALFCVLVKFVANRINLLENGAKYPGHWKRMCAWMQAGVVLRALSRSSVSITPAALEEWTHGNMTAAGHWARLVDARDEPLFWADPTSSDRLKKEILGRLRVLKVRHEKEGRQVPEAATIDEALARATESGEIALSMWPGPLETHRRPKESIPPQVSQELERIGSHATQVDLLRFLATVCQLCALGESELDRARKAVIGLSHEVNQANLESLAAASIVAAASRDVLLANNVADAVIRVASQVTEKKEIYDLFVILLQAAVAHETHDAWFQWLEDQLTNIATQLPGPPSECLRMFQDQLDEIATVLPVDSWFQVRARSITSSGIA